MPTLRMYAASNQEKDGFYIRSRINTGDHDEDTIITLQVPSHGPAEDLYDHLGHTQHIDRGEKTTLPHEIVWPLYNRDLLTIDKANSSDNAKDVADQEGPKRVSGLPENTREQVIEWITAYNGPRSTTVTDLKQVYQAFPTTTSKAEKDTHRPQNNQPQHTHTTSTGPPEQEHPYICTNCETEIHLNATNNKIICPKCSNRSVLKQRPDNQRHLKAR
jgi:DNA-directed RNA polymerase subunit RPC12/RpoP